jgi:hypothetical protein
MDDLNVWGVNWLDGMLVTSRHFDQQQDFVKNLARFATLALAPGYGIVKWVNDKAEPLEVSVAADGKDLTVSVVHCAAIMPNGFFVNINADFLKHQAVQLTIDTGEESGRRLAVYLYASPSEPLAFGDPEPGEELARAPWQVGKLTLSVGADDSLPAAAGFQIAELVSTDDGYVLDRNFVPASVTTSCGKAVVDRMEKIRQGFDKVRKAGLTALAEVRQKRKEKLDPNEGELVRAKFLQTETMLHQLAYGHNRIFDTVLGVSCRELIDFCTGMVRGFAEGFDIYPELRTLVRSSSLEGDWGTMPGGSLMPELEQYQLGNYGLSEMPRFFDDSERVLGVMLAILRLYAGDFVGPITKSLEIDGHHFEEQQHGAVKHSFRDNCHYLILDGVDPRGTRDVAVRLHKKLLPAAYAQTVMIYLGPNDKDGIPTATLARKPFEDPKSPDYWVVVANQHFPIKEDRLDRLHVIIDGDVDASALEAVHMEDISIFSRPR